MAVKIANAESNKLNKWGWNTVAKQILSPIILAPLIFWMAGTVNWFWGWVFNVVHLAVWIGMTVAVWQSNPELLNARGKRGKNTKGWDMFLLGIYGIAWVMVVVVGAFDHRYGWSPAMPFVLPMIGAVLVILGFGLTTWGMMVNRNFEVTVRIQEDRGHQVIITGPYAIVRHPGYVGVIVGFFIGMPLLLDSWMAFVPALVGAFVMVIRTGMEDRMLHKELAGYAEFAQKTRYRLLPGLW